MKNSTITALKQNNIMSKRKPNRAIYGDIAASYGAVISDIKSLKSFNQTSESITITTHSG